MIRAHLDLWGWRDAERSLSYELRLVSRTTLKSALASPSAHFMRTLDDDQQRAVMRLMRSHNPVVARIHRHTRQLLREYHRVGLCMIQI